MQPVRRDVEHYAVKAFAAVVAAALAAVAGAACNGNVEESSSGSGPSFPSCKNNSQYNQSCVSCVESACASDLSNTESDCKDYLACFEQCDCSDEMCLAACSSKAEEGNCPQAAQALTTCETQTCVTECEQTGDVQISCTIQGGGAAVCVFYANASSADASALMSTCSMQSGSIGTACSSTNLVGCCEQTVAGIDTFSCEYSGTAGNFESTCVDGGGMWSTSAPP